MYNNTIPGDSELPSSKQLVTSTLIALVSAVILLFTVILPAEYGYDPTGVGEIIGLTQMGNIKQQLALEAEQEAQQPVIDVTEPVIEPVVPAPVADVASDTKPVPAIPTETRTITLKPGEAAEIKLGMHKDAVINYEWSVDSGHVNYDTHGDGDGINYFGYGKGKATTDDKDQLIAAFDGKHGWFWRNRSDQTVVVTLIVSGDYSGIYRVL